MKVHPETVSACTFLDILDCSISTAEHKHLIRYAYSETVSGAATVRVNWPLTYVCKVRLVYGTENIWSPRYGQVFDKLPWTELSEGSALNYISSLQEPMNFKATQPHRYCDSLSLQSGTTPNNELLWKFDTTNRHKHARTHTQQTKHTAVSNVRVYRLPLCQPSHPLSFSDMFGDGGAVNRIVLTLHTHTSSVAPFFFFICFLTWMNWIGCVGPRRCPLGHNGSQAVKQNWKMSESLPKLTASSGKGSLFAQIRLHYGYEHLLYTSQVTPECKRQFQVTWDLFPHCQTACTLHPSSYTRNCINRIKWK